MKRLLPLSLVLLFAVAPPLFSLSGADTLFTEGNARFERGDYAGAAERYQDLVRRYPGSDIYPDALYRLGIARIKTGRSADGVALLERLEARYPAGRYRTAFWIGYGYRELGRSDAALSAWERYLADGDPLYRSETMISAAYVLYSTGNDQRAEEFLATVRDENPRLFLEQGGLVLAAEIRSSREDWAGVIELAGESPDTPAEAYPARFLLKLGTAYRNVGDWEAAEASYRRILETGASDELAAAYGRLFALFEAQGRIDAMEDLILDAEDRLAADRSALAGFWFRVGAVLAAGDRPARGIGYLKRAWDVRGRTDLPGTLPLFYAQALTAGGDAEGAVDILETALDEEFGDPARLTFRLARTYAVLERWEESLARLESPAAPASNEAAALRARALLELGRYAAGLEVVSDALSSESSPEEQAKLLELAWRLQAGLGEWDGAVKSYAQLRRLTGAGDVDRDRRYTRLLFNARLFEQVVRRLPSPGGDAEESFFRGLALVGLERYEEAGSALREASAARLSPEYAAVRGYYLAWSLYRLGRYREALDGFTNFRAAYPGHQLDGEAAFYAGWSAFTLGEYSTAARQFAAYGTGPRREEAQLARARALAAAGKSGEAILVAEGLADSPGYGDADEALYLVFDIRISAGDLAGSARALERLSTDFPGSQWSARALYRQGEAEFDAGNWRSAAVFLDRYRRLYPEGENGDDALYHRAATALAAGEERLALLLWERLVDEYPRSTYRPQALAERGRVLSGLSEYREAIEAYRLLVSEYPAESRRLGADAEIDKLERFLVSSGSEYRRLLEASRSAGGVATREGRTLLIEAVRSAMAEGRAEEFSSAGAQVRQLLDARPEDGRERAHILRMAAEYSFRRNEYRDAATRYLSAAAAMPGDPDFTAEALFRAAQMSLYAGNRAGYQEVLERLRSSFPGSPWLEEAEDLRNDRGGVR